MSRVLASALAVLCLVVAGCTQQPPAKSIELTSHERSLTVETFDEIMDAGKPVLVDFSATWCSPCMEAKPEIEALAKEMDGELIVAVADMTKDDSPAGPIATAWNVSGFPTLVLVQDRTEIGRSLGMPRGSLRDWVQKQLDRAGESG